MAEGADGATAGAGAGRPGGTRLRWLVAAVVALESVVLVGLAVAFVVESITGEASQLGAVLALAGVFLVVGAGLGACGYGVGKGLHWSRGPTLTWQLLQAGVAMPISASDRWYIGIPLLAAAVFVGALLMSGRVIDVRQPEA
jgi:hypothetical protein